MSRKSRSAQRVRAVQPEKQLHALKSMMTGLSPAIYESDVQYCQYIASSRYAVVRHACSGAISKLTTSLNCSRPLISTPFGDMAWLMCGGGMKVLVAVACLLELMDVKARSEYSFPRCLLFPRLFPSCLFRTASSPSNGM